MTFIFGLYLRYEHLNALSFKVSAPEFPIQDHLAARSCCDLDLQDSNLNLACDTSQYGDHFCDIVLKSDFK